MADLSIHHDKIINTLNRIIGNEKDRASDVGEDREAIGKMLELTGLNKKAMSFCKALHKMEAEKRDDVLRSFDALRFELEKNWGGQKTPDMFDAVDPADDDEDFPAPSYEENFNPTGDAQIDGETDDFERHLAAVAD